MYLNVIFLMIILLGIIFASYEVKNIGVIYLLTILIVLIALNQMVKKQDLDKEFFSNLEEAQEQLRLSAAERDETSILKKKVGELEGELDTLKTDLENQLVQRNLQDDEEATDFDLKAAQKKQDDELLALEKETDILLKLYRKENETVDKTKYKTIPVFSSCKVNDMGSLYKREGTAREKIIENLQNEELGKNLGVESESSRELIGMINREVGTNAGNVDVNFNLSN